MDTTTFLAQMWGPALLAVALGTFVSREFYIKIYRDLDKEGLAVLLFGMVAIAAGVAHIVYHHSWNSFPEIVISLLGWGLFVKGIAFAVFPHFVDKAGDWEVNAKLIPVVGVLTLIAGAYISWIGYFA